MAKISSENMQKYRNILNFLAKTLDFLLLVCYNVIVDANNLILADMAELADAYGSGYATSVIK